MMTHSILSMACLAGAVISMAACANNNRVAEKALDVSARDAAMVRSVFVAKPVPSKPSYVRTTIPCIFFVRDTGDGAMLPVGMLQKDVYLILRREDGEWTDVQLATGQMGSVLSSNLKGLTSDDERQGKWQPARSLEPLPRRSTASASSTSDSHRNPLFDLSDL